MEEGGVTFKEKEGKNSCQRRSGYDPLSRNENVSVPLKKIADHPQKEGEALA